MHAGDNLSESDLKKIFETAGFQYSKETISCCFIFLLKKGKNLLHIHKNDLKEFEFISNTLSGCAACDTQMFGMMPQFFKRK